MDRAFFFGAGRAIPLIRRFASVRNENRSVSKTNMLLPIDEFAGANMHHVLTMMSWVFESTRGDI